MKRLNDHYGIITSIEADRMIIDLPNGGTIQAPKTEGIRIGDCVAFLMDAFGKKVVSVMLKQCADEIVARGTNHIYEVADRDPLEEEDHADRKTELEWHNPSVLWCPDLG